jgi:hypothetical protein
MLFKTIKNATLKKTPTKGKIGKIITITIAITSSKLIGHLATPPRPPKLRQQ